MKNRLIRTILGIGWATVFLLSACENPPATGSDSGKSNAIETEISSDRKLPEIPSDARSAESEKRKAGTETNSLPVPPEAEPALENDLQEIDWGKEISLAEMIAKAKSGEIREIEWHVMPNVLRARTADNRIFHLKNENKGVDLRNKLMEAGVPIGRGGVLFRHVF